MCITNTKLHSDKYKMMINELAQDLINKCYNYIMDLLSNPDNKIILENIANELLEKETLNKSDLLEIIPSDKIGNYELIL